MRRFWAIKVGFEFVTPYQKVEVVLRCFVRGLWFRFVVRLDDCNDCVVGGMSLFIYDWTEGTICGCWFWRFLVLCLFVCTQNGFGLFYQPRTKTMMMKRSTRMMMMKYVRRDFLHTNENHKHAAVPKFY